MSPSRSNRLKRIVPIFPICFLLVTTGCVTESVDSDGTQVFRYETWVPLLIVIAGVAALLAGFRLMKLIRKLGVACILGGGIAAFVIGPSMFCDSATISKDHFSLRTGLWGMTARHDFEYAQLASARYIVEQSVDKKGRQKSAYSLVCEHNDGEVKKVPLSNEVAKMATPKLIARLIENGVPVSDETSPSGKTSNHGITDIRRNDFIP